MKRVLAAAVLLLQSAVPISAPAIAQEHGTAILAGMVPDSDAAVVAVRDALTSYHGKYGRWPESFPQLVAFAKVFGRPIDTAAFESVTYGVGEANGGSAAAVEYVMAGSGAKGAFAITFNAIE